jgi:mono/diheme cytochrome c family protein
MRKARSRTPAFIVLVLVTLSLAAACGGDTKPAETTAAAPQSPPPPASADVVKHMHDHLAKVQEVHQAVVRGDLDGAKTAAGSFANHEELAGMPDKVQAVSAMKRAAKEVTESKDIKAAGEATAAMAAACGSCHQASSAKPPFSPTPAPAKAGGGTKGRMLEHQRAVEMLYQGLIAPSDELWARGAEALKAAPLKEDKFPASARLSKEALSAQIATHEVALKAVEAKGLEERADAYGDLIGGCATCHSLSGRVIGPGAPKQ